MAYFDAVATQWDGMRKGFFSDRVRDLALAASGARAGENALDVGAGTGFLTQGLVERGLSVTALDPSQAMLDVLGARWPAVRREVGGMERVPAADGAFDRVVANMVLHHVERPASGLKEAARVLRPGGTLVLTDLVTHPHERLLVEHHDRWLGFDPDVVALWMQEAGLVDVSAGRIGETCADSDCVSIDIFLARGRKADVP